MDRITLRGLRAYGRHGNDTGERDRAQPFDLDLALDLDLAAAAHSDDLRDTLDYAALARRVAAIVEQTSYRLLERLAADVAAALLDDARVRRVEVTIAKPGLLAGATPAVTLVRARAADP